MLLSIPVLYGQRTGISIPRDSVPVTGSTDTLFIDSLFQDSLIAADSLPLRLPYRISPDAVDAPVSYQAADSLVFNLKESKMILYNRALIKQRDIMLESGHIEVNWSENLLLSHTSADSTGKPGQRPQMTEGNQQFQGDTIRYNFKSRRGIIVHVTSEYDDLYVLSNRIKYYGKDAEGRTQDVIYGQNAIFTTCNHPEPHYGIRSQKQKVIPERLVVVGPSNLEIANVPTPLWLPFGFFPISSGQRDGIIFPRDFENSPAYGFGIRNVGYYMGIGDHFDVSLTGDIYSRGSWGIQSTMRYNKRYAFQGGLNLGYSVRQNDEPGTPDYSLERSFQVKWNHSQAQNAHPSQSFSANVNLESNNYLSLNNNDAASVLNNQLGSNVTYNKNFLGTPFSMTASMSHSQNTNTRDVTIRFPVLDFRMNQIFPFQRASTTGSQEAWYEKIAVGYNMQTTNELRTKDTLLFQPEMFDDMRYGVRHTPTINATYNIFKFFRISPNINYTEKWYFQTVEKSFDPTPVVSIDTIFPDDEDPVVVLDTIQYGSVIDNKVSGFRQVREFSAGASLSTILFGTVNFRRGRLRAIRHTVTPSLNYSYSPNYLNPVFNYVDSVQVDSRFEDKRQYSYFENSVFGAPPQRGLSSSLGLSIGNVFESKWRRKMEDGKFEDRKFKVFDRIVANGSYNFAADSLHFSTVNVSGNTLLFRMVNFDFRLVFDPYEADNLGRRKQEFVWDTRSRPVRFVTFDAGFSTRMDWFTLSNLFSGKTGQDAMRRPGQTGDISPFLETLNINHNIRFNVAEIDGRDTFRVTVNSLDLNGIFNLSQNWRFEIRNIGYDFSSKQITYPDITFYRDLHCWEMGLSWQPIRGTYSFYLRVKPSSLDFINIPYRKANYDPPNVF